jgi:ribokinase
MKYDVLTIGGAVFDLFIRPEKESILRIDTKRDLHTFLAFPHGSKLEIDDIHEEFGGGAANVAVNVSVMGLKSAILARIGDDYYGNEIQKNLKKHKVSTDGIQVASNQKSGFSIIVNSYDGERTVLYSRGANNEIPKLSKKLLQSAGWVHITSLPPDADKFFKELTSYKKKNRSLKISWNPGTHQLKHGYDHFRSFLSVVDVLFLNRDEVDRFTRTKSKRYDKKTQKKIVDTCHDYMVSHEDDFLSYVYDVRSSAKKLLKMGVKMLVITDGRRGAQLFESKNHYYIPCGQNKPVATLGAGDSFCSGFVAGMIFASDPQVAVQYATLNAGSVVSQFGAQKGIMKKRDLENNLGKIPVLKMS